MKAGVSPTDDINFHSVGHISENPKVTLTSVRVFAPQFTNVHCENPVSN